MLRVTLIVVALILGLALTDASVSCNETSRCEAVLRPGSICVEGVCSNPYQSGCLINRKEGWTRPRVCSSQDPPDAAQRGICRNTPENLDYMEVRIASCNWESVFFEAWVMQILLSELLSVPTSIETGFDDVKVNFYEPTSRMEYGLGNELLDAVDLASSVGDCRQVTGVYSSDYTPCAHVYPECWSGHFPRLEREIVAGTIEPTGFIGVIGQESWFIPQFTAERDPTLLNYLGLAGKKNRHKLAKRFKRPTTWLDYCLEVSVDNCTEDDGVAARAPLDETENDSMFAEGLYTGYFRYTDENNCTLWPDNCTGHVADYPCGWTSWTVPNTYWLDIGLRSSGKQAGSHGYTYSQLTQIWQAANWTKTDVMMQWWFPEVLYQTYLGTDAEFQYVELPPPTHQCIDSRIDPLFRCNGTFDQRIGPREGACSNPPTLLRKVVATSLRKNSLDPSIDRALQSPGYDAVMNFRISESQMSKIFEYWINADVDKYGFDARDAVCRWFVENFEELQTFVPSTFPRVIQGNTSKEYWPLFAVAIALGVLAVVLVVTSCVLTFLNRKESIIRHAQVEFLLLLLLGLLLVAGASIVQAVQPTDPRCIAVIWLVYVGYTLELVPFIVKVAAINHLMQAAKRMKRVRLSKSRLFGAVAGLCIVVMVYVMIWTLLDPPTRDAGFALTDETTADGETIITATYSCQSQKAFWNYVGVGAQCCLLVCASVLAYQTRKLRKDINETQTLAILIYSHFVFVSVRLAVYAIWDSLDAYAASLVLSLIYSIDSAATIIIYFVPKFFHSRLVGQPMSMDSRSSNWDSVATRNAQSSEFPSARVAGEICDHKSEAMEPTDEGTTKPLKQIVSTPDAGEEQNSEGKGDSIKPDADLLLVDPKRQAGCTTERVDTVIPKEEFKPTTEERPQQKCHRCGLIEPPCD